ncbi:hypothetical protein CAPTEDRAFT_204358 [Capitella teleta]|uniref:HECT domain-containing protein n=1 Tax=Capitella teleta TaxID=283909 RepID=R7TYD4_CAPTE|nr:hypothetical protein CAPTEDRAFT_204358 [Capitella teleta]|eukprot:ELT98749.1 hypothetical protein CAPTEDRAFT_204358 [Capitella teleta]
MDSTGEERLRSRQQNVHSILTNADLSTDFTTNLTSNCCLTIRNKSHYTPGPCHHYKVADLEECPALQGHDLEFLRAPHASNRILTPLPHRTPSEIQQSRCLGKSSFYVRIKSSDHTTDRAQPPEQNSQSSGVLDVDKRDLSTVPPQGNNAPGLLDVNPVMDCENDLDVPAQSDDTPGLLDVNHVMDCKNNPGVPAQSDDVPGLLGVVEHDDNPDVPAQSDDVRAAANAPSTPPNIIDVDRDDILDLARPAFARSTFRPEAPLSVKFLEEPGIDTGCLRREFMTLALRQIRDSVMFNREDDRKMIRMESVGMYPDSFEDQHYLSAGRMIAHFLVHEGPGLQFFCKTLYAAIVSGPEAIPFEVVNVLENDLRSKLEEIQSATDDASYARACDQMEDIIDVAGATVLRRSVEHKLRLVKAVCRMLLCDTIRAPLAQLCEGLEMLGVLGAIKKHPVAFEEAFVSNPQPLRAEDLERLYVPSRSQEGSQRFLSEKKAIGHFKTFLRDMEADGRLPELLQFMTGMDRIPPLFLQACAVSFSHHVEDCSADYPHANTCSFNLRLPLLRTYKKFKENFICTLDSQKCFTDF